MLLYRDQFLILCPQFMLASLGDGSDTKDKNKIVVLAHDRDFWPRPNEGDLDMAAAFGKFLKMAKEAGYVFRKLSDYPSDL